VNGFFYERMTALPEMEDSMRGLEGADPAK
jgi:hypothetical protein